MVSLSIPKQLTQFFKNTYFQIHDTFSTIPWTKDYPQICPLSEYYAGSIVLSFRKIDDLNRDFRNIWKQKGGNFTPIIVAKELAVLKEIEKKLLDLHLKPAWIQHSNRNVLVLEG